MPFDFNTVEPPKDFSLIPTGTFCKVSMTIRAPENELVGNDPLLTKSADGTCQMLDCEFTVLFGQYANRKFWSYMVLVGTTPGQKAAENITKGTLRAILESARNVNPTDSSEAAHRARLADIIDFDGLEFAVKTGIQKDKTGQYEDKNKILSVVTPDKSNYAAIMSGQDTNQATGATAFGNTQSATPATGQAPAWANKMADNTQQQQPANSGPAWANPQQTSDNEDSPF